MACLSGQIRSDDVMYPLKVGSAKIFPFMRYCASPVREAASCCGYEQYLRPRPGHGPQSDFRRWLVSSRECRLCMGLAVRAGSSLALEQWVVTAYEISSDNRS